MEGKNISKGHLFLLELVIVILFFSFASAIALQVFSKAHTIKEETIALNAAMMAVQSKAEESKLADSPSGLAAINRPISFDEDWNEAKKKDAAWKLNSDINFEERTKGTMAEIIYQVTDTEGKVLYSLTVKKYFSKGLAS